MKDYSDTFCAGDLLRHTGNDFFWRVVGQSKEYKDSVDIICFESSDIIIPIFEKRMVEMLVKGELEYCFSVDDEI